MINNNMRLPLYLRKKLGGMSQYQSGGIQNRSQPNTFSPVGSVPTSLFDYQKPMDINVPTNNQKLYETGQMGTDATKDYQKINPIENIDGEWVNKKPDNQMDNIRNAMYIGNPLLRGISEMHAQGQQQDYQQTNTANPLANLAYNDGRSSGVKYGYEQYQKGGSIVDYLDGKGLRSDMDFRKGLAQDYNIKDYKGTAEQNLFLLKQMQNGKNSSDTIKKENLRPKQDQDNYNQSIIPLDNYNNYKNYKSNNDDRNLESGVITDKRMNMSHVVENGKIVKSFKVLTGVNPDDNDNNYTFEEMDKNTKLKNTPVGSYFMNPDSNIYGQPGFNYNPISAFGQDKPKANLIAQHITYHPEEREKYYKMSPEERYRSYGCINCQKSDINDLTTRFPKGDTAIVVDSKNPKDRDFLKKMGSKYKMGGTSKWRGK